MSHIFLIIILKFRALITSKSEENIKNLPRYGNHNSGFVQKHRQMKNTKWFLCLNGWSDNIGPNIFKVSQLSENGVLVTAQSCVWRASPGTCLFSAFRCKIRGHKSHGLHCPKT